MSTTVQRVVILGAESTGKSTLAKTLAAHYQTRWVPEYLRTFVDLHQRTPHAEEQFLIATMQRQHEAENEVFAHRFLFCDTSPLMTAIYSDYYFGGIDAPLGLLASQHDYAATIVTAPTTPWMPDGLQRESDDVRQQIHARLLRALAAANIAYQLVDGNVEARMMQVIDYLENTHRQ
ncbi:AAA family ATPase [Oxalicibacterium faecigallinarum]|uniref:NadR/Ttd14 AAA domain-containing protein n=1 Tax=Oxalicibacterium faecigallinarum TaxID=573741 RepID=A0A8J3AUK1_9BURK|nr:ATP-binding protein [Oxalicibacterium faecigallinarum]GGI19072.1 hypothetical protein GCM10008066_17250 [Oxalicibacterium faecigallinarum]